MTCIEARDEIWHRLSGDCISSWSLAPVSPFNVYVSRTWLKSDPLSSLSLYTCCSQRILASSEQTRGINRTIKIWNIVPTRDLCGNNYDDVSQIKIYLIHFYTDHLSFFFKFLLFTVTYIISEAGPTWYFFILAKKKKENTVSNLIPS